MGEPGHSCWCGQGSGRGTDDSSGTLPRGSMSERRGPKERSRENRTETFPKVRFSGRKEELTSSATVTLTGQSQEKPNEDSSCPQQRHGLGAGGMDSQVPMRYRDLEQENKCQTHVHSQPVRGQGERVLLPRRASSEESGDGREASPGQAAVQPAEPPHWREEAGTGAWALGSPVSGRTHRENLTPPCSPRDTRCRSGLRWKLHGKQMWQRYVR